MRSPDAVMMKHDYKLLMVLREAFKLICVRAASCAYHSACVAFEHGVVTCH